MKRCPFCAEEIQDAAIVCKHCGRDLPNHINCPYCGARLVYLRTEGETHFYRCDRHGMLMLPPDGRSASASLAFRIPSGRGQPAQGP